MDVINFLIHCGADVNTQDMVGNTPLHAAALSSSVSSLLCLFHHGATPDKNNDGQLPDRFATGIHAEECRRLIKAYTYKIAKKKMNEQHISSFIDKIKVNVAMRKKRVNGFGKKFAAVHKVVKAIKKFKSNRNLAKHGQSALSATTTDDDAADDEEQKGKTNEVTSSKKKEEGKKLHQHFDSMNAMLNPLHKAFAKKIDATRATTTTTDDEEKIDSNETIIRKKDENTEDDKIEEEKHVKRIKLSDIPGNIRLSHGIVTDVPIIIQKNFNPGDSIHVELPCRGMNTASYEAIAIVPEDTVEGEVIHLVMTLDENEIPVATGTSIEHLDDNLHDEFSGQNLIGLDDGDGVFHAPKIKVMDGVRFCQL